MKFVSVYEAPFAVETLYQLLRSRAPELCISHRKVPTYEEHERFFKSKPYRSWMLLEIDEIYVGSIYLTEQDELGVHLFPQQRGKGYEAQAITTVIAVRKLRFPHANINPANTEYAKILEDLGFKLIQHTYEKIV